MLKTLIFILVFFSFYTCTVLKRKYQKGYYVEFFGGSSHTRIPEKTLIAKNIYHPILDSNKSVLSQNNFQSAHHLKIKKNNILFVNQNTRLIKYKHCSTINFTNHSYKNDVRTHIPHVHLPYHHPQDDKPPREVLKQMAIWNIIGLILFIITYSFFYTYIFDILNTSGMGLGCLFLFVLSLMSIVSFGIIFKHIFNFIYIMKNKEATQKQKFLAGFMLLLAILFHPLLVFLYTQLIIVI